MLLHAEKTRTGHNLKKTTNVDTVSVVTTENSTAASDSLVDTAAVPVSIGALRLPSAPELIP